MKNKIVFVSLLIALVGCASKPPMPPEPKGPLVKVNMQQPHNTFGNKKSHEK